MKAGIFACTALAAMAMLLFLAPNSAVAEDGMVTQATLLDRIQVEDLLVRYYADLSSGKGHDLAQYFTEDAALDVNGMISKGREYTELVKRDGRWYIKKRYITAASGMPAIWDDTYKPREHR
jgi:hypothetical protein